MQSSGFYSNNQPTPNTTLLYFPLLTQKIIITCQARYLIHIFVLVSKEQKIFVDYAKRSFFFRKEDRRGDRQVCSGFQTVPRWRLSRVMGPFSEFLQTFGFVFGFMFSEDVEQLFKQKQPSSHLVSNFCSLAEDYRESSLTMWKTIFLSRK